MMLRTSEWKASKMFSCWFPFRVVRGCFLGLRHLGVNDSGNEPFRLAKISFVAIVWPRGPHDMELCCEG